MGSDSLPDSCLLVSVLRRKVMPDRSYLGRKNPKQRKNEVDSQKRNHVVVRLRTARLPECCRSHDLVRGYVGVRTKTVVVGPDIAGWACRVARGGSRLRHMAVRRNLAGGQRDGFSTSALPQSKSRSHMHRDAALKVGQSEGVLSVASIGRADQVEKGVVL